MAMVINYLAAIIVFFLAFAATPAAAENTINLQELYTTGHGSISTHSAEHTRHATAVHEAGHALMFLAHPESAQWLEKVTIQPSGQALGLTHSTFPKDFTPQQAHLYAQTALAGYIAERVFFEDFYPNYDAEGASSDLVKVLYVLQEAGVSEVEIDAAIERAIETTNRALRQNRAALVAMAGELLSHTTLHGDDLRQQYAGLAQ